MIVDGTGKPLPPKRSRTRDIWEKLKSFGKKGLAIFAALILVPPFLLGVIDLYERVSEGPTYSITVQVSNHTTAPIEIASLLDFYVTRSQFHWGIVMAGEAPTGRMDMNMVSPSNGKSPYTIAPGGVRTYVGKIRGRPYKSDLESGGSNIVFVLRVDDSDRVSTIEQPFHDKVMRTSRLEFDIK